MSNKVDEAFYNTLESPQRRPSSSQGNTIVDPATVNDYDYTNMNDESYQKLNPVNALTKNMYSSLVTSSSKAQVPQDYLTPVMSDLKEQYKMSNTTSSPVVVKEKENVIKEKESSKKGPATYLWILLLLLTCISLLVATVAVIIAIVALSKASSTNTSEAPTVVTGELRSSLNDNISTTELDQQLLQLYMNITTQLNKLMQFISDVESTGDSLRDELKLIKGDILSLNNATRRNERILLRRTTEIAMIGFDVQDLTTQLRTLRDSQQTDRDVTPGNPTSSPLVKVPLLSQVYTQWGKQSCSSEGVTSVYTGYAAGPGSFRRGTNGRQQDIAIFGGGTNMLCLTSTPSLRASHDAPSIAATVYAAQYLNDSINFEQPQPMPCSVCEVQNTTSVLTIPGSDRCPEGWTVEYNGFIMAQSSRVGRVDNFEESEYICVDDAFESYSGANQLQQNRADTATFMSAVKVDCGQGIPCSDSSYSSTLSLTCAVCSKRTL